MLVDSSKIGGIETHILNVALLLKQHHVDTRVMFLKKYENDVFYKRLAQVGVHYDFLDGFKSLILYIRQLPKDTVIHTHGYKAGILGRVTAALFGKKVASTFHAGETHGGMLGLYCKLDNVTSILSKNFAVSPQIAQRIYNPEGFRNFVLQASPTLTSKPKNTPLNIGFVGRLSKEKGPDQFLSLAEHFKTDARFQFHVFGDGSLKPIFHDSQVKLHGLCEPAEIWQMLDVLVISSYYEGLPMTVLEAMASGVFVISPHVGALDEVVQHLKTGIVASSNHALHLAQALELRAQLNESDVTVALQNAKTYCFEQFGGFQQWTQLDRTYRTLLSI